MITIILKVIALEKQSKRQEDMSLNIIIKALKFDRLVFMSVVIILVALQKRLSMISHSQTRDFHFN